MTINDDSLRYAQKLLDVLGTDHPKYQQAFTLLFRLRRNVEKADTYGSRSDLDSEQSEIVTQLDRLSRSELKISFMELDKMPQMSKEIVQPQVSPVPITDTHHSDIKFRGRKLHQKSANATKLTGELIFLSHSSDDKPFVRELNNALNKAGLNTWFDENDIEVTHSIPGKINEALSECAYFLIILTPNAIESKWVTNELNAALMMGKTIVPVLLKTCEIPPLLKDIKYADFRSDHLLGLNQLLKVFPVQTPGAPGNLPALSSGLLKIFSIIERACYNGDILPAQGLALKILFGDVAMKKQKGEKPVLPRDPNNSGEIFSYSSEILTYHLLSLAECHEQWPNISTINSTKSDSLALLKIIQDQIYATSLQIQQITKTDRHSLQEQRIVSELRALRQQFARIDKYIYSGSIPFKVADEIEMHFDDLIYHLNNYIVTLKELAKLNGSKEWLQ